MRIIYFILYFLLSSCNAQDNDVLQKSLDFVGGKDNIDKVYNFTAMGVITIESINIKLPFVMTMTDNMSRFEQMPVENGMDLSPGIVRLTKGSKAQVIVDERPMNNGFNVKNLNSDETQLWKESEFIFPFAVDYYLSNNSKIVNFSTEEDLQIITFKLDSGEKATLYFDQQTNKLVRHKFVTHHIQLGKTEIDREYLSYKEKNGLKYPNKWKDKRGGLELIYTINDISFNGKIEEVLFSHPDLEVNTDLVSADVTSNLVNKYISELESKSPFTENIRKISQLKSDVEKGKYSNIESAKDLGRALSDDIIEITNDHHFGIEYNPDLFEALTTNQEPNANSVPEESYNRKIREQQRKENYYFKDTGIKNGYYYFELSEFVALENVKSYFDSLMVEAAKSKGLIIDLRNNSGGRGDFALYMTSYFLPEKSLLYTNVTNRESKKIRTISTEAQPKHKNFPIYILINKRTGSAGEFVPYALQNYNRATVVGETTFGMAHPSIDVPLGDGFVGFIPVAYSKYVKTGKDWEGTGVEPDIEIDPDQALEKVLMLISKQQ